MRVLLVVVMLFASSAAAQVASVCGPGKVCNVRKLVTTVPTPNVSWCDFMASQPGASFGVAHATSAWVFGAFPNNDCSGSVSASVGQLSWNLNAPSITGTGATYMVMAQGYEAPLAFASFPTCVAGNKGRQLFDLTNNVWKYCNGSSWVAHGAGLVTPGPTNGGWTAVSNYTAAAASEDVNFLGPFSPSGSNVNVGRLSCNWATAGTGGTNGVYVSIVAIGGGTVCSCNIGSCTQVARGPVDCSCAGPLETAKIYVMQLTSSTDCTANPQNITCNATLVP